MAEITGRAHIVARGLAGERLEGADGAGPARAVRSGGVDNSLIGARLAHGERRADTLGNGNGGLVKDDRLKLSGVVADGAGVVAVDIQHRGRTGQRVSHGSHTRQKRGIVKVGAAHAVNLDGGHERHKTLTPREGIDRRSSTVVARFQQKLAGKIDTRVNIDTLQQARPVACGLAGVDGTVGVESSTARDVAGRGVLIAREASHSLRTDNQRAAVDKLARGEEER